MADAIWWSSYLQKEPGSGSAELLLLEERTGKEQSGTAAPRPSGMAYPPLRPEKRDKKESR